ncbi:hypothetical protein KJZ99_08035 [bacterium]|nr:hypothetical protein [bacterium]
MKKSLYVLMPLIMATTLLTIRQLNACTAPTVSEQKASFTCDGNCRFDAIEAFWTCTANSGSYKVHVGVSEAGAGGTFVVKLWDTTPHPDNEILSQTFSATGNCASGDFSVNLINGHEYRLYVDGASGIGCNEGEQAWAKMCYTCPAN